MRLALVLAVALSSATAATAQVVQDRYGPPRTAALAPGSQPFMTASLTRPYAGPILKWANKRAPEPAPAAAAPPPAPVAAVQAPAPVATPAPPPAPVAAPDNRYANRPARIARPLTPPPAPPLPAPPAPIASLPATSRPEPSPIQPIRQAAAAPTPARPGGAPPRYYSLHREYGLAPDSLPAPPTHPRYVLIGPPDEPGGKTDGGKSSDRDDDPST
jgi:hypothetical protein